MSARAGKAVAQGALIDGKYRVERVLGRGGMGLVVAAVHLHLGGRVAIKVLKPGSPLTPAARERFLREGRAAARIRSEHVARVLDAGVLEGGAPYLVFEYLDGIDLRALLRRRGPLSVDTALAYVLQACEGLAEAHALGIVHRDIKPANLFLARRPAEAAQRPAVGAARRPAAGTARRPAGEAAQRPAVGAAQRPAVGAAQRRGRGGVVKVIDFGVSKMTEGAAEEGSAASLTAYGAAIGTPHYMAPEQMRSARIADARADIWAIGAVIHGLLTGAPPFPGETMIEVYDRILRGPPRLRDARADAPAALEEIVARCLRVDPAERPGSVAELGAALLEVLPPERRTAEGRALPVMEELESDEACPDDDPEGEGDTGLPFSTTASLEASFAPEPATTEEPLSPSWTSPTTQPPLRERVAPPSLEEAAGGPEAPRSAPRRAGGTARTLLVVASLALAAAAGAALSRRTPGTPPDTTLAGASRLVEVHESASDSAPMHGSPDGAATSELRPPVAAATSELRPPVAAATSELRPPVVAAPGRGVPASVTSTVHGHRDVQPRSGASGAGNALSASPASPAPPAPSAAPAHTALGLSETPD